MWKVVLIIALIIGAFWYFQPDRFNRTLDIVKEKIGLKTEEKEATETTETTEVSTEEDIAPIAQGYCIIDERCVYVSERQCEDDLYSSRSECEAAAGITAKEDEEALPGLNYVGFPLDINNLPYNCMTDNDCRHDNSNCSDVDCQCDYSTGQCYIL